MKFVAIIFFELLFKKFLNIYIFLILVIKVNFNQKQLSWNLKGVGIFISKGWENPSTDNIT